MRRPIQSPFMRLCDSFNHLVTLVAIYLFNVMRRNASRQQFPTSFVDFGFCVSLDCASGKTLLASGRPT